MRRAEVMRNKFPTDESTAGKAGNARNVVRDPGWVGVTALLHLFAGIVLLRC